MTTNTSDDASPVLPSGGLHSHLQSPAWFYLMQSLIVAFVFAAPTLVCATVLTLASSPWWRLVVLAIAVPLWLTVFALACGVASIPFRHAIKTGTFPRDLRDPVYRGRRLYGLCWTSLYYAPIAYHLVLAFPALKWAVFRLFGYKGTMRFTVYPDTWIRDLPLLRLGEGAYVSNKATLGTNMPLMDGRILVDHVSVGRDAYVGHQAMMAAGTSLGDRSETGAGTAVGIRVSIGKGVQTSTGPVVFDHHARVFDGATIGTSSYIGKRAVIGEGVAVPEGLVVPGSFKARDAEAIRRLMASQESSTLAKTAGER